MFDRILSPPLTLSFYLKKANEEIIKFGKYGSEISQSKKYENI